MSKVLKTTAHGLPELSVFQGLLREIFLREPYL
jgi:hypothetical protein